jgi:hypothetical protein
VKFRHIIEVHSVDAYHKSKGHKKDGENGENLDDLVGFLCGNR